MIDRWNNKVSIKNASVLKRFLEKHSIFLSSFQLQLWMHSELITSSSDFNTIACFREHSFSDYNFSISSESSSKLEIKLHFNSVSTTCNTIFRYELDSYFLLIFRCIFYWDYCMFGSALHIHFTPYKQVIAVRGFYIVTRIVIHHKSLMRVLGKVEVCCYYGDLWS